METANHEYYVSPEVANLLEKAGFDWRCRKCYNKGVLFDMEPDEIRAQVPQHSSYDVLAPTLEVAQRWLREVKNLSVDISSTRYSEWEYIIRKINQANHNDNTIFALTACRFYTYEEAKEAGIKKALEIILEEGE